MPAKGTDFYVRFKGDDQDFKVASKSVQSSMKKIGSQVESTQKRLGGLRGAAGRAFKGFADIKAGLDLTIVPFGRAIGGIKNFIENSIKAADESVKMANNLGLTVREYDVLKIASERAGADVSSVAKAFKTSQTAVYEARNGLKTYTRVLDSLGVEVGELDGLSPIELFTKLGKATADVVDPTEKAAVASRLFGRSGQQLITLFDRLNPQLEEAEELTDTYLGNFDSTEQAAIEAAADAFQEIELAVTGFSRQIAIEAAPVVSGLVQQFREWIEESGGIEKIVEDLMETLRDLVDVLKTVGAGAEAFFGFFITTESEKIESVTGALKRLESQVIDGAAAGGVLESEYEQLRRKYQELTGEVYIFGGSVEAAEAKIQDITEASDRWWNVQRVTDEQLRVLRGQIDEFTRAAEDSEVQIDEGTDALDMHTRAVGESGSALEKSAKALEERRKALAENTEGVEESIKSYVRYSNVIGQAGTHIEVLTGLDAELARANDELRGKTILTGVEIEGLGEKTDEATDKIEDQTKAVKEGANALDDWRKSAYDVVDILEQFGIGSDRLRSKLRSGISLFDDDGLFGAEGGISGAAKLLDKLGSAGSLAGGLRLLATGPLTAIGGAALSGVSALSALPGVGGVLGGAAGIPIHAGADFAGQFGFTGKSAVGAGLVANAIAGYAGNYIGNQVGESLFGKRATNSTFGTIGGIAGSFFGPLGTFGGATIGSVLDAAFGRENRRQAVGFFAGPGVTDADDGYLGEGITGASGLVFQGYARRSAHEDADALAQAAVTIDNALTAVSRAAGLTVDFSGRTLAGTGFEDDYTQGTRGGANNGVGFFGLSGNWGLGEGSPDEAASLFVTSWIDAMRDQLSGRANAMLDLAEGTAEQLVGAFERILNIDMLLDLDVVNEMESAIRQIGEGTMTLVEAYDAQSDALLEVVGGYDGSLDSLTALNDALITQKTLALELAVAYREVGLGVSELLGSTAQNLRDSLLSEQELQDARRASLDDLISQLDTAVDPDQIAGLVTTINDLVNEIFRNIDVDILPFADDQHLFSEDNQRAVLVGALLNILDEVEATAQERVNAGLAALSESESNIEEQANEALITQKTAAETWTDTATSVSTSMTDAADSHVRAAERHEQASDRFEASVDSFDGAISTLDSRFQSVVRAMIEAAQDISRAAERRDTQEVGV